MKIQTIGILVRVEYNHTLIVYTADVIAGSQVQVLTHKNWNYSHGNLEGHIIGFEFEVEEDDIISWKVIDYKSLIEDKVIRSLNMDGTVTLSDDTVCTIFKGANVINSEVSNKYIYFGIVDFVQNATNSHILLGVVYKGVCYGTKVCAIKEYTRELIDQDPSAMLIKAASAISR